jgi:hypothetical protein
MKCNINQTTQQLASWIHVAFRLFSKLALLWLLTDIYEQEEKLKLKLSHAE